MTVYPPAIVPVGHPLLLRAQATSDAQAKVQSDLARQQVELSKQMEQITKTVAELEATQAAALKAIDVRFERTILSVLGLRPYRCMDCDERFLRAHLTRTGDNSKILAPGDGEWTTKNQRESDT